MKRIPADTLAAAVKIAQAVSIREAGRRFGMSPDTVRKEINRLNLPKRRPGNYTKAEIAAMTAGAIT